MKQRETVDTVERVSRRSKKVKGNRRKKKEQ